MNSKSLKITPKQKIKNSVKKQMIEELRKTPIIQFVCQKYNVPRSTFYRWMKSSKKFNKDVEDALKDGDGLINDLAVSQIINKIKNGNNAMIIFWLKCKHPDFLDVRRINYAEEKPENPMTEEKRAQIARAIILWKGEDPDTEYNKQFTTPRSEYKR